VQGGDSLLDIAAGERRIGPQHNQHVRIDIVGSRSSLTGSHHQTVPAAQPSNPTAGR
jgi:hypothetical protein